MNEVYNSEFLPDFIVSVLKEIITEVFTTERFFEVPIESWPKWELNP